MNDPKGWLRRERGLVISLAAKNPRIVLASRVFVITRLGEFRVRHEMSSFCPVYKWKGKREREREITSERDSQVKYSIIENVGNCNSGSTPLFALDSCTYSFFLPIFCILDEKSPSEFLCAPSHFPPKLLLTLDAADNSPLGYTLRPIIALFTKIISSFYFSQVT